MLDYGSTILSDSAAKESMREELKLVKPYGNLLLSQLQTVENLDEIRHFSRCFQPLTLGMKKIWSFYEFRESKITVKVVVEGIGGTKRITSTEIKAPVGHP